MCLRLCIMCARALSDCLVLCISALFALSRWLILHLCSINGWTLCSGQQSEEYTPSLCLFAVLFHSSLLFIRSLLCFEQGRIISFQHVTVSLSDSNHFNLDTLTISSYGDTAMRDLTAGAQNCVLAMDTVIFNKKRRRFHYVHIIRDISLRRTH